MGLRPSGASGIDSLYKPGGLLATPRGWDLGIPEKKSPFVGPTLAQAAEERARRKVEEDKFRTQLEEEQAETFLGKLGRTFGGPGYAVLNLLRMRPGAAIKNLADTAAGVAMLDPITGLGTRFASREEQPLVTEVMEDVGIGAPRSRGLRAILDVGGGLATDPLSYLTLGGSAIARATKMAESVPLNMIPTWAGDIGTAMQTTLKGKNRWLKLLDETGGEAEEAARRLMGGMKNTVDSEGFIKTLRELEKSGDILAPGVRYDPWLFRAPLRGLGLIREGAMEPSLISRAGGMFDEALAGRWSEGVPGAFLGKFTVPGQMWGALGRHAPEAQAILRKPWDATVRALWNPLHGKLGKNVPSGVRYWLEDLHRWAKEGEFGSSQNYRDLLTKVHEGIDQGTLKSLFKELQDNLGEGGKLDDIVSQAHRDVVYGTTLGRFDDLPPGAAPEVPGAPPTPGAPPVGGATVFDQFREVRTKSSAMSPERAHELGLLGRYSKGGQTHRVKVAFGERADRELLEDAIIFEAPVEAVRRVPPRGRAELSVGTPVQSTVNEVGTFATPQKIVEFVERDGKRFALLENGQYAPVETLHRWGTRLGEDGTRMFTHELAEGAMWFPTRSEAIKDWVRAKRDLLVYGPKEKVRRTLTKNRLSWMEDVERARKSGAIDEEVAEMFTVLSHLFADDAYDLWQALSKGSVKKAKKFGVLSVDSEGHIKFSGSLRGMPGAKKALEDVGVFVGARGSKHSSARAAYVAAGPANGTMFLIRRLDELAGEALRRSPITAKTATEMRTVTRDFFHEMFHNGYYTMLTPAERREITHIFNEYAPHMEKADALLYRGGKKKPGGPKARTLYAASSPQEFFAELGARVGSDGLDATLKAEYRMKKADRSALTRVFYKIWQRIQEAYRVVMGKGTRMGVNSQFRKQLIESSGGALKMAPWEEPLMQDVMARIAPGLDDLLHGRPFTMAEDVGAALPAAKLRPKAAPKLVKKVARKAPKKKRIPPTKTIGGEEPISHEEFLRGRYPHLLSQQIMRFRDFNRRYPAPIEIEILQSEAQRRRNVDIFLSRPIEVEEDAYFSSQFGVREEAIARPSSRLTPAQGRAERAKEAMAKVRSLEAEAARERYGPMTTRPAPPAAFAEDAPRTISDHLGPGSGADERIKAAIVDDLLGKSNGARRATQKEEAKRIWGNAWLRVEREMDQVISRVAADPSEANLQHMTDEWTRLYSEAAEEVGLLDRTMSPKDVMREMSAAASNEWDLEYMIPKGPHARIDFFFAENPKLKDVTKKSGDRWYQELKSDPEFMKKLRAIHGEGADSELKRFTWVNAVPDAVLDHALDEHRALVGVDAGFLRVPFPEGQPRDLDKIIDGYVINFKEGVVQHATGRPRADYDEVAAILKSGEPPVAFATEITATQRRGRVGEAVEAVRSAVSDYAKNLGTPDYYSVPSKMLRDLGVTRYPGERFFWDNVAIAIENNVLADWLKHISTVEARLPVDKKLLEKLRTIGKSPQMRDYAPNWEASLYGQLVKHRYPTFESRPLLPARLHGPGMPAPWMRDQRPVWQSSEDLRGLAQSRRAGKKVGKRDRVRVDDDGRTWRMMANGLEREVVGGSWTEALPKSKEERQRLAAHLYHRLRGEVDAVLPGLPTQIKRVGEPPVAFAEEAPKTPGALLSEFKRTGHLPMGDAPPAEFVHEVTVPAKGRKFLVYRGMNPDYPAPRNIAEADFTKPSGAGAHGKVIWASSSPSVAGAFAGSRGFVRPMWIEPSFLTDFRKVLKAEDAEWLSDAPWNWKSGMFDDWAAGMVDPGEALVVKNVREMGLWGEGTMAGLGPDDATDVWAWVPGDRGGGRGMRVTEMPKLFTYEEAVAAVKDSPTVPFKYTIGGKYPEEDSYWGVSYPTTEAPSGAPPVAFIGARGPQARIQKRTPKERAVAAAAKKKAQEERRPGLFLSRANALALGGGDEAAGYAEMAGRIRANVNERLGSEVVDGKPGQFRQIANKVATERAQELGLSDEAAGELANRLHQLQKFMHSSNQNILAEAQEDLRMLTTIREGDEGIYLGRLPFNFYLPNNISNEWAEAISRSVGRSTSKGNAMGSALETAYEHFRKTKNADQFRDAIRKAARDAGIDPEKLKDIDPMQDDLFESTLRRWHSHNRAKWNKAFIEKAAAALGSKKTASMLEDMGDTLFDVRAAESFLETAIARNAQAPIIRALEEEVEKVGGFKPGELKGVRGIDDVEWPGVGVGGAEGLKGFMRDAVRGMEARGEMGRAWDSVNWWLKQSMTVGIGGVPFLAFSARNLMGGMVQALMDPSTSAADAFRPLAALMHDVPIARWFVRPAGSGLSAEDVSLFRKALEHPRLRMQIPGETFDEAYAALLQLDDESALALRALEVRWEREGLKIAGLRPSNLLREIAENGIVGKDYTATELFKRQIMDPRSIREVRKALIGTGDVPSKELPSEVLAAIKTNSLPRRLASSVEDTLRLNTYLSMRSKGIDPFRAAERVNRVHIDYRYISEADRNLRSVIPFIRFRTGTLPVVAEQMITRPATTTPLLKLMHSMSPTEGELIPPWLQDRMALPLGLDEDGNMMFLTSFGLIHEDVNQLLSGAGDVRALVTGKGITPGEWMQKGVLSSIHPFLKGILEYATGKSFYFGTEWGDYRRAPSWMTEIPGMEETLTMAGLLTKETAKDGTDYYKVPRWYHPAMGMTPLNRLSNEVHRVLDKRKAWTWRVIESSTGIKLASVDQERELRRALGEWLKDQIRSGDIGKMEVFFAKGELPPEAAEMLKYYNDLMHGKKPKREAVKPGPGVGPPDPTQSASSQPTSPTPQSRPLGSLVPGGLGLLRPTSLSGR